MPMNKAVKKKWVKALLSGDYEQGLGRLCMKGGTHDEFCCLGVLCNIHAEETGGGWTTDGLAMIYEGRTHHLPENVRVWSGMTTSYGRYAPTGKIVMSERGTLAGANDSGKTFKAIAALISKYF